MIIKMYEMKSMNNWYILLWYCWF